MWGVTPSARWDWAGLKAKIAAHGLRNSLLVAPMPTASTAQIMGNNECFEPYTSNLYNRRVMAGDFPVINPHLIKDLIAADLWSVEMKHKIMAQDGSVHEAVYICQYHIRGVSHARSWRKKGLCILHDPVCTA